MNARPTQIFAHAVSRVLHTYADWRIGPTAAEKHCYKQSDSILFTFDDYGTVAEVRQLLEILDQEHVKAMFFANGDWAMKHPRLVALIASKGHVIGNHTLHHAVLTRLSDEQVAAEITGGVSGPWLRPPEGRYNKHVRAIAAGLGNVICYWDIDSLDWTGASVERMMVEICPELRPGAAILFHINGPHTRELLPVLCAHIRSCGFRLTDRSETWAPPAA